MKAVTAGGILGRKLAFSPFIPGDNNHEIKQTCEVTAGKTFVGVKTYWPVSRQTHYADDGHLLLCHGYWMNRFNSHLQRESKIFFPLGHCKLVHAYFFTCSLPLLFTNVLALFNIKFKCTPEYIKFNRVYSTLDFIRIRLVKLWGTRGKGEFSKWKVLAHSGTRSHYLPLSWLIIMTGALMTFL